MSDPPPVFACDLWRAKRGGADSAIDRGGFVCLLGFERFEETSTDTRRDSTRILNSFRTLSIGFLLERCCCPFLRLELRFEPSPGPVWLPLRRWGPGVKEFLGAAGFKASPSKRALDGGRSEEGSTVLGQVQASPPPKVKATNSTLLARSSLAYLSRECPASAGARPAHAGSV